MKGLYFLCFALFAGIPGSQSWLLAPKPTSVCYSNKGFDLGCYDKNAPFEDLPLPQKFQPQFHLFTRRRNDEKNTIQLDLDRPTPSEFDPALKTKIIIHGYMQSWYAEWMHEMKNELLIHGDYNVILVDWSEGSQLFTRPYPAAASNTRFTSTYLASLLGKMVDETGLDMSTVHCIGHSLGAQTCGFAGAKLNPRFGRVTGLDPAGPRFKDKPKEARLDPEDADFVDSIHSNGKGSLTLDLGIGQQLAHVDFIPNGGGLQPGCVNRKKRWNPVEAAVQTLFIRSHAFPSCSHSRSFEYFTESINSNCSFIGVPCADMKAATHLDCGTCEGDECQLMGFYADTRPGRGIFYVKTARKSPYCLGDQSTW